jgi:hypothetical protein
MMRLPVKYQCLLLIFLGGMLFMISCGLFPVPEPPQGTDKLDSVTIFVKTQNLPSAVKLDRFYATDDAGAQIGAGAPFSDSAPVKLAVPSSFVGQELNICAGYSLITYASEKVTIAEGVTAVLSADGINIGVPGGVLPEIPGVTSPNTVTVTYSDGISTANMHINNIYAASCEGSKISTAIYSESNHEWSINMLSALNDTTVRFWVDFNDGETPLCFYEDIVWMENTNTLITVTYRGTPITNHTELRSITGTNDFVITNTISASSAPWTPVAFSGTLHGGGFKVSGIKFAQSTGNYGLFSTLEGNVYDLRLEYADTAPLAVTAASPDNMVMAGILAGETTANATIKNVMVSLASGVPAFSVKSAASGAKVCLGGIVGRMSGGTLSQSYSSARIELAPGSVGDSFFIGGLAGMSKGEITTSYARGSVSADGAITFGSVYAGGLAGGLDGSASIDKSYAAGDVLAVLAVSGATIAQAGGLVGKAEEPSYVINNSVAANGNVKVGTGTYDSAAPLLGSNETVSGSNNIRGTTINFAESTNKYANQGAEKDLTDSTNWSLFSVTDNTWRWDSDAGFPRLFWQQNSIDLLNSLNLENLALGFPIPSIP